MSRFFPMRTLTSEEESLLLAVIETTGQCESCVEDDPLPDEICDRLIERGLVVEVPCAQHDINHIAVTPMGKLVLELKQILKAG